nr:MAG TPA: hypothetical protein [Caudoviricetes sp.]
MKISLNILLSRMHRICRKLKCIHLPVQKENSYSHLVLKTIRSWRTMVGKNAKRSTRQSNIRYGSCKPHTCALNVQITTLCLMKT